ncbi:MAG: DoxX family protein [Bacteroidetes bacterium]|nr:DoxX family protein [Bacteroidota bacterium]
MNTTLWIAQIILAAAFLYSGICKTILSEQQLIARGQTGVVGLRPGKIHFIGVCEIAGSIGIILPRALNILPFLTTATAACFAVVMLLAAPIHYRLKEPGNVATNMTLLLLSLFVILGRSGIL